MIAILVGALIPALYWEQGTETAATLRELNIVRLRVPAHQVEPWKKSGFDAAALPGDATKVPAPGVRYQVSVASATRVPWVDANGWRFLRNPGAFYLYENLPKGSAALAAAEAYVYGVEAAVGAASSDVEGFSRMLAFLSRIDRPRLPARANIGIVDDGSAVTGEVMNLLARRNLLFQVISAPDRRYSLNIRIGSKEFPKEQAANPFEFAAMVRERLTDEKRFLRVYGSDVVLGYLTGDDQRGRLHLINYGPRPVNGLRVRVLGLYRKGTLATFGSEETRLMDYSFKAGAAEFTVPVIHTYAVVDLEP